MKITTLIIVFCLSFSQAMAAQCQAKNGNWYSYNDPRCNDSKSENPELQESDQKNKVDTDISANQPPTQKDLDGLCETMGKAAASIASSRDSGIPLSTQLNNSRNIANGNESLEKAMRAMIIEIYEKTYWSPDVSRQRIELACIQSVNNTK